MIHYLLLKLPSGVHNMNEAGTSSLGNALYFWPNFRYGVNSSILDLLVATCLLSLLQS